MEETRRLIEMRENGRLVKMTVSRANLRAIQVKALKGDHRSQELLFEMERDAESRRDGRASELLRVFNEMKAKWRALCEQCDRAGEARPISIPHPDDIRFDHDLQTLTTLGPVSERGRQKEELRIGLFGEARKRLARLKIAMAEDRAFSPRCLDEKRLGEAVVGLLEDAFPGPEVRRANGFNLDHWVAAARAHSAERAVTLESIPFFTTMKASLQKRGCPSLEDFGPDELRPAVWNVGSDGDEVDFATLLTIWLTVDREYGEEDTSDWI
ncbi:MAG: hypothetical protein EON59_01935 [Alphaproteobacteria bacterium]|nr:MAG: hypothetical protein EON59_01935 [Alphaproteobacteria bacterium]